METFCETVQFYLKHLEGSVYPVMTEDQFAMKLFPMYRYFVTVWLRNHNPEVRSTLLRGSCVPPTPGVMDPQPVWPGRLRDRWVQPHSQNPRGRERERQSRDLQGQSGLFACLWGSWAGPRLLPSPPCHVSWTLWMG